MKQVKSANHNENFIEILNTIQSSKQKAYQSINKILAELYFEVGKILYIKVTNANWGKGVVKEKLNEWYLLLNQKD